MPNWNIFLIEFIPFIINQNSKKPAIRKVLSPNLGYILMAAYLNAFT
jgi:hypothetical protein